MTSEKREFKEAFIQLLPKAWQRVSEMLESTADFEERRFVVQTVMDRSYGKVVERKDLSGPGRREDPDRGHDAEHSAVLQQVLGAEPKILLDAVADEDTTDRHLKTPGGRPMLE